MIFHYSFVSHFWKAFGCFLGRKNHSKMIDELFIFILILGIFCPPAFFLLALLFHYYSFCPTFKTVMDLLRCRLTFMLIPETLQIQLLRSYFDTLRRNWWWDLTLLVFCSSELTATVLPVIIYRAIFHGMEIDSDWVEGVNNTMSSILKPTICFVALNVD